MKQYTKLVTVRVSEDLLKALKDLQIDISKVVRSTLIATVKKAKKAS